MLQPAITDLFSPIVPKAHNSECQNCVFLYKLSEVKVSESHLRIFIFVPSALLG